MGLLMLMLLVVAHEFGHFIAARRNGVDVEEFGIGFPPRAIAWRKVGKKWRKLTRKEWDKTPGEGLIFLAKNKDSIRRRGDELASSLLDLYGIGVHGDAALN